MANYSFYTTENIVVGFAYDVEADSVEQARKKYEDGDWKDWECRWSTVDTLETTLDEIGLPDGTTIRPSEN